MRALAMRDTHALPQVCFPVGCQDDLPLIYKRGELRGPGVDWDIDAFRHAHSPVFWRVLFF